MYLSLNWIKEYTKIPSLTGKELSDKITLHIAEVEGFEDQAKVLDKIIVAKVVKIEKHPNADKLKIAHVNDGKTNTHIVCGGTNLQENQIVALALPGAMVKWHGEGDLIEIKKGKIRDIESHGMICASTEIGVSAPNEGPTEILDLEKYNQNKKWKIGSPLSEALGINDLIFEIDNKSLTHRPDLWGIYGFARDLAAVFNTELKSLNLQKLNNLKESKTLKIKNLSPKNCPRYMAVQVDNIEITESPAWLQEKLLSSNINPKNNIVDATNYIMLLLGQPMHAFDSTKIDNEIIVRQAKENEKFLTLDGIEKTLNKDDLVIADSKTPIALAGVMGGGNSEIDENTTSIIIESANFNPISIRKSAGRHNLHTDSSQRFEKSLDPKNTETAINLILNLIKELSPNSNITSQIIDLNSSKEKELKINLNIEKTNKYLGYEISSQEAQNILEKLHFKVLSIKNDTLDVLVPSFRATKDIELEEDLIEEIARIKSYEHIPSILPKIPTDFPAQNNKIITNYKIRDLLVQAHQAYEVMNYSFNNQELIKKSLLNLKDHLEIENPLSSDQSHLRTHLIPSMLQNFKDNALQEKHLTIFEFGNTYLKKEASLPNEETYLNILSNESIENTNGSPFYKCKQILSDILLSLNYKNFQLKEAKAEPFCHPNKYGEIILHGQKVGYLAEIHPLALKNHNIKTNLGLLELNINKIINLKAKTPVFKELNKYPGISIDVSIIFDRKKKFEDIKKVIQKTNSKLIKDIKLFDVFESEKIGKENIAYAFNILLQSEEKTLTDQDMNEVHKKIFTNLVNAGGELRQ